MKEIETIKNKIVELESKKEALSAELQGLSQAINDSFEDLLLGKVEEKTIDQAKEKFESLSAEVQKTDEYIQRAKSVRKKLAFEKVIPFAKDKRQKAAAEIQSRYNDQIKAVHEARAAFLEQLAALGKIRNEVGGVNAEYSSLIADMGETSSPYGISIQERPIVSGGWSKPSETLGLDEATQRQAYSGVVPNGFKGAE
jgi:chromosome segregation ATPase